MRYVAGMSKEEVVLSTHRMPRKLADRIDAYAAAYRMSRTAAINFLSASALDHHEATRIGPARNERRPS